MGVRTIAYYIRKRRHTINQTIIDQPILEECRGSERQQGSPPHLGSWEQDIEFDLDEEKEEDDDTDGFNLNALLEALTAGGVFDVGAIAEGLTETEGVRVTPLDQRDPRERYMERPDGR